MKQKTNIEIHPTAIIDEGADVGDFTKVWHWSHICSGAVIGNNCSIGQNVFISGNAIIGNNVKIQNNVSVYDDVIIGDDVFCGPSMVFTNVKNPRSEISRKKEYKKTYVKKGVTLGANCTIVCGIEIGEYAFIGAGALINKNIKPFALVLGVPGIQKGWMSAFGERINFELNGCDNWICPETGDKYQLKNGELSRKVSQYWLKN